MDEAGDRADWPDAQAPVQGRQEHRPVRARRGGATGRSGSPTSISARAAATAELLIDFLDHVDSDTLYLVGDIIDGWRLKKRFYWPERAQ